MSRPKKKPGARASGDAAEDRLRAVFERSALVVSLAARDVELPEVQAPSTERLEVTVPRTADLTEDDLARRLQALARGYAQVRECAAGEAVQLGDEVCLDVLGYADGRLIPFSARVQMWTDLTPSPMLPGFFEGLVGVMVGEGTRLQVTLPADYPLERLRGARTTFLVDVCAARQVELPDMQSAAFIEALGRGPTIGAVIESIADELEAELADELWVEAQNLVIDELLRRADAKVSEEAVDEEIRRRWKDGEGRWLVKKRFSSDELQEALAGWLADPLTRADASRRLQASLVLRAIAVREKLQLTPERLERIIQIAGKPFGFAASDLGAALKGNPALAEQVTAMAFHLMALGHVMEKAKVLFEGAPAR
ncbi:MAG: peptidylprolyl isomerase [Deltaproteobacteria bacterium]|nr:peptidylprolyl isomerase [Deltaproteobacteria bacterium]